jgi:hypothetical protein
MGSAINGAAPSRYVMEDVEESQLNKDDGGSLQGMGPRHQMAPTNLPRCRADPAMTA